MKCGFATGEVYARDVSRGVGVSYYSLQQIEWKELGVCVVEIVIGAKAVAAVKIADVG